MYYWSSIITGRYFVLTMDGVIREFQSVQSLLGEYPTAVAC